MLLDHQNPRKWIRTERDEFEIKKCAALRCRWKPQPGPVEPVGNNALTPFLTRQARMKQRQRRAWMNQRLIGQLISQLTQDC